jgi:AAA domain
MPFVTLDRITKQKVQWLWPGRLTLGHLAILDGDPGLGKSLVTLDLCARISTGRPFPDGQATGKPASVIVINAEDGARDIIPGRLIAAGADLSRVQVFDREPGEAFLRLPGQVRRLEDAIARSGARYVVLDPIMSFLDSSVNIASDQSVRAALAPLADLAQRHGCAIQMVRHLNKGRSKNALYRGLYSIGFIASCRLSWLIARDPQRVNQFVIAQPKNNLDSPQSSLTYTIEADETGNARIAWRGSSTLDDGDLMAGTPDRLRIRMRAQAFLLEFLKDGPRTTREIWEAAQPHRFSKATLDRARVSLKISTSRIHGFTPEQTNYWLLPSQPFTPAISDSPELDEQLRKLNETWAPRSPLDEEVRLPG